ncbi:MAG: DsbA family protein [Novosphingobium sp.]|jgi:protein-disulfide isomerase|nr:DsbA family protein [Novosphingobium sp.]
MRLIHLAIMLAAAAVFFWGTASKPAAGQQPDWSAAIALAPGGGHAIGNPAAPVKLIEYISYTCPHCAHFQQQSEMPMLRDFIRPGKVQVEVRHLIRDPIDMTAAMLANCGAPGRFLANHSMFLQSQARWIGVLDKATAAQEARWASGDNLARMRAIAGDFGFYAMMQAHGYDRPTLDRCLADTATARRIAEQTAAAGKAGVTGTPMFMLNGVLLAGTYDWESLNSQLEARF